MRQAVWIERASVRAVWVSETLNELGLVMDFRDARRALDEVTSELDHRYLNELGAFSEINPSTEGLARHIHEGLAGRSPEGVELRDVTVWESEGSSVTFRP